MSGRGAPATLAWTWGPRQPESACSSAESAFTARLFPTVAPGWRRGISHVLGLDLEDAEKARKGGGPGGKRPEARWIVEEAQIRLFEQIHDLLMEEEFYHMPGRAVLLSGGGAKDPRVSGIAARILSCHVSPARARKRLVAVGAGRRP